MFTNLLNRPTSINNLAKIEKLLFIPISKNANVTVQTFRGCGLYSHVRYYVSQWRNIKSFPKNHFVAFFNASSLQSSSELAIQEMLGSLQTDFIPTADTTFDTALLKHIKKVKTTQDLLELINFVCKDNDYFITFCVYNLFDMFNKKEGYKEASDLLTALHRINPMKTSFLFFTEQDLDGSESDSLGTLLPFFVQTVVAGKNFVFTSEGADCLFANLEQWHNYKFDSRFVTKCKEWFVNDPTLIKHIAMRAMSDESFSTKFIASSESALVELCGSTFIENRFDALLENMNSVTVSYLFSDFSTTPPEYLLTTGLIVRDANSYKLLNPFYAYYFDTYKDVLKQKHLLSKSSAILPAHSIDVTEFLTGKELIVYKYLQAHTGEVVKRESIAKVLWGENWEAEYSDWNIDKFLSNIRKKLATHQQDCKLTTIRGQGYMLS